MGLIDSIILVSDKDSVTNFFSEKQVKNLPVLDKEDLVSQNIVTTNVRYIISTWYFPTITDEELDKFLPNLKHVFYAAGDTSYFSPGLLDKEITIYDAKITNGKSVADFVLGQILLANKGYYKLQTMYKRSIFKLGIKGIQREVNNYPGNYSANIGLLGFGAIARQLADLLSQFEFNVFAYDPFVSDEEFQKYGVKKMDLEDIFNISDVVSNHLPDIPATSKLIDYRLLSLLHKNATFINTGRGRQVNELDLARISFKNKDITFLLDVTSHEPILPLHPFYFQKNIYITPHIAGSQANEKRRMTNYMYELYLEVKDHEKDEVN